MNKFNIVFKLITPLLIGLFLVASISIFSNFYFVKNNIKEKSEEFTYSIFKTYSYLTKKDTDFMQGLIEQLEHDENTIKLYKNNDRKALFEYLNKTFLSFKERYNITHFYIHSINKQNFIRLHDITKHSDFIRRQTLTEAARLLKPTSGIEFGIHHNLTLRVVLPWFAHGELIGFIELGKELDTITPELKTSMKTDFVFTLKKELVESDFKEWKQSSIKNLAYKAMNKYCIIDSSITNIDVDLQKHLDAQENNQNLIVTNHERKYYLYSQPYFDMNQKELGKIHILYDITKDYDFLFLLILKVTAIVIILLSFVIWYYIKYLKKQQKILNHAYRKIQKLSITDGLTKLYNRRYFDNIFLHIISNAKRKNELVSFLLLDIDHFKLYNDNYGHQKGDDVLKAFAKCLKTSLRRADDLAFRLGGEEFGIVFKADNKQKAIEFANIIRTNIENLKLVHEYNSASPYITASIGLACVNIDASSDTYTIYKIADEMLYIAKDKGRNQVYSNIDL